MSQCVTVHDWRRQRIARRRCKTADWHTHPMVHLDTTSALEKQLSKYHLKHHTHTFTPWFTSTPRPPWKNSCPSTTWKTRHTQQSPCWYPTYLISDQWGELSASWTHNSQVVSPSLSTKCFHELLSKQPENQLSLTGFLSSQIKHKQLHSTQVTQTCAWTSPLSAKNW